MVRRSSLARARDARHVPSSASSTSCSSSRSTATSASSSPRRVGTLRRAVRGPPRPRRAPPTRRARRGTGRCVASSSSCVPWAATRPPSSSTTVGQRDRAGPVGDHDRRAAVHHRGHRVADLVLLRRVDRAGGVVEHEHPWVGEDRPGDGDALALAPAEREAAFADHRVVAVGQVVDELGGAGELRGRARRRRARRPGRRRRCCRRRCR